MRISMRKCWLRNAVGYAWLMHLFCHIASLRNAEHRVAQRSYSSTRGHQIIDYIVLKFASARFQTTTHLSKPSGRDTTRIKPELMPMTALSLILQEAVCGWNAIVPRWRGRDGDKAPKVKKLPSLTLGCWYQGQGSIYCMYRFAAEILSNKNWTLLIVARVLGVITQSLSKTPSYSKQLSRRSWKSRPRWLGVSDKWIQ
jgi:hypothetical protein